MERLEGAQVWLEQQKSAAHQEQGTDGEEGEGQETDGEEREETEGVLCGTVTGVKQSDKLEDNIYR